MIHPLPHFILKTPSPLHYPCIHAAFRVKDHPSPASGWFTTPSPAPSLSYNTGLKALDLKTIFFKIIDIIKKVKLTF